MKAIRHIPAATVDEYLKALPVTVRSTLEKVRKAIKSAAPTAKEVIGYQMPMYKLNGYLCAFAAFNNHCSFFTTSHAVMKTFKEELKPYDYSGVTIRFPLNKPLPPALVKKLVKAKMNENVARLRAKEIMKKK